MKKPKILILIMSVDIEFFNNQMEDVKATWLSQIEKQKDIISKYADIVDWKYYDTPDNSKINILKTKDNNYLPVVKPYDSAYLDEKNEHHLICSCWNDNMTFDKTMLTFEWCKENCEYDYIIRTNTSTYINLPLLSYILYKEYNTNNNGDIEWHDKAYGTDLMSIYSCSIPSYSDIYIRGNCLILTKKQIDIILKYSCMFSNECINNSQCSLIDDVIIGSILNCYYNNFNKTKYDEHGNTVRNFDYLEHIKPLSQIWYKCAETNNTLNHTWSPKGYSQKMDSEDDENRYSHGVAIQVRSYYTKEGRESTEHRHYNELNEKMEEKIFVWYKDENNLLSIYNKIKEYQKNPDVWIQGNLQYASLNELLDIINDKNKYINFVSYCYKLTPIDHPNWINKKRIIDKYGFDFLFNKTNVLKSTRQQVEK